MKRKLFILGYFGYYNLGDDMMLELIDKKQFGQFEIFLLSRRDYYKNRFTIINRYNFMKYIIAIKKNDVLLNLGGVFQDKTGIMSFIYYFIMNGLFLLKKGKIAFLNTDFSDVKRCKFLLGFLLRKSRLIGLRSRNEYQRLQKIYPGVRYIPDIVFLYGFKKLKKDPSRYILASLRYESGIDTIIKQLKKEPGPIKFLLMKNEDHLKEVLIEHGFKNRIYKYNYMNSGSILDLIYNADRIVTMRYHIGILGLLWKKEVRLIESNNKIKMLNHDFNVSFYTDKKKIDKLKKRKYINVLKIRKEWDRCFMRLNMILKEG
ncbi:MAG: polysaccharide pyruvyl transferase family protein [Spirochaetes bacterium]|nr:polysaccharide pyruvyl transferase family protein [Spirochaetota bacterium]